MNNTLKLMSSSAGKHCSYHLMLSVITSHNIAWSGVERMHLAGFLHLLGSTCLPLPSLDGSCNMIGECWLVGGKWQVTNPGTEMGKGNNSK